MHFGQTLLQTIRRSPRRRFTAVISRMSATAQVVFGSTVEACGGLDAYFQAPGSRAGHHAYKGGLLAHSVEVAELALASADVLADGGMVDTDLLVLLALLHDVGKINEYRETRFGMAMSDSGRWVGHKAMGCVGVGQAVAALEKCDQRLVTALLNGMVGMESSGTRSERGYATLEAIIVNRADQISAAGDLFRMSIRATGGRNFYGVRHPHLREQPLHPVAIR